ncbi:MAG: septum formation inhibitor Maf [Piscirickettsiaceae bacterium]|nr:septum formation inhibitor Maf [Piscirickettsiaceae bacterium]
MNFPRVYLASGSPRRSELLAQIGIEFDKLTIDVDESRLIDEMPLDYVQRIAQVKAKAGWAALGDNELRPVIGADTSVIIGQDILGKPKNKAEAKTMLKRLSNNQHEVLTAVSLIYGEQVLTRVSYNKVTFAPLTEAELDWYITTGEGEDKAGSYAVQGLAALFIKKIEGSYSGIMGLPLRETMELLIDIGSTLHEQ